MFQYLDHLLSLELLGLLVCLASPLNLESVFQASPFLLFDRVLLDLQLIQEAQSYPLVLFLL